MTSTRKRMVVTGRQGQVVQSLLERGQNGLFEIITLGRPELDLSRPDAIDAVLRAAEPDVIVSAAAYTAVDQAETDEEAATVVNGVAAGKIAETAAALGVPMIHLSTDYVFDGSKLAPYVETDPVAPIGAYGRSKLAGERAVTAANPNHVILRTAWVYSPFGKNFLKTMLKLAESRDSLNVVNDQIGNPTSALDIADAVLQVAQNLLSSNAPDLRGIFHMTGTGECNWADFAFEIFALSKAHGGPHAAVTGIPSAQYPTPAKRPANSRLDCTLLNARHGVRLPDWRDSTAQVIGRLLNHNHTDGQQ
ncbi:dTDP-4-dehydrorhamnose reductase [Neorhizobium sp. SOG26]|uniref:dTDP-4-dehydrorhamnose reductase n=1 Tax=Neorhizobium sp. SOG26 TaxID=2060726 RepID=UPI000E597819|nr:dTDP-4-dehydrorhamnose reductase [Neorhizobium sp. SOG26]AXV14656.1 dTDP-4-dehydrorhamnose reductase [Neorhizobium sp. SOG26]